MTLPILRKRAVAEGLPLSIVAAEALHVLTCVTTNKTKLFRTGLGEIRYHQIKHALFFGYSLERGIPRAHPAKAALDFVYLELRNSRQPALDDWNWDELDFDLLRSWESCYPKTVGSLFEEHIRQANNSDK